MTTYRLERISAVDLQFDGDLLAEASTEASGGDRWQEVRIYRTSSDQWVVERAGHSRIPGEVKRSRVWVCPSVADVRRAVLSKQQDNPDRLYITDVVYEALSAAVELDHRLDEALVEHV